MTVRRWSLLCDAARLSDLRRLLNQDELRRADRLVTDRLTRRFVVARAGLRTVLGETLGMPAGDVSFEYGPMGKPLLSAGHAAPRVHFNLAHSGDEAVVAISRDPVGVDLEVLRPMPRAAAFAERWFHPAEQQRLAAAPEADRLTRFFEIWTAKESALKLLGKGVGDSLPRILTPEGDGWVTELPANELGAARCWITRRDLDSVAVAIATPKNPPTSHSSDTSET